MMHLWRCAHDSVVGPRWSDAIGVLSDDELARGERQRDPQRRRGFLLTRAVLRLTLARYLGRDPASLRFTAGEGEKPTVDGPVRYSTSMTSGLSLIAVAAEVEVGVDVEALSVALDPEELAPSILTPAELAAAGRPDTRYLLERWVAKEAVLKAAGVGLRTPPSSFSAPAEVEPGHWAVEAVDVGEGFVAALAAPAPLPRVERHEVDFSILD